jgi:hypothetical protein
MRRISRPFTILALTAGLVVTSASSYAACSSPAGNEGAFRYDTSNHRYQYCDNTDTWQPLGSGSSGATGVEDHIVSGTHAVYANESSGYVSLSTTGTDWGYLGATASYLPRLNAAGISITTANGISSTNGYFNGKVGIGVSAPATTLDVAGNAKFLAALRIGSSAHNTGSASLVFGHAFPHSSAVLPGYSDKVAIYSDAAGSWGLSNGLRFAINATADGNSVTSADTRMVINSSGNVGIGTTSPNVSLSVVGEVSSTALSIRTVPMTVTSTNLLFGRTATRDITTTANVGFGYQALNAATLSGDYNTAVGFQAIYANVSGVRNTGVGYQSLLGITTGSHNTGVGMYANKAVTTGSQNVAMGYNSLAATTTADYNVAVGTSAITANITGASNVAVGTQSMLASKSGGYNTAVGTYSLLTHIAPEGMVAVGYASQMYVSGTAGNAALLNTSVGYEALRGHATGANNTGDYNTALGYRAAYVVDSGISNTALGKEAGLALTSGNDNVFVGAGAGDTITTGSRNIIIGVKPTATATGNAQLNIGDTLFGNTATGSVSATNISATVFEARNISATGLIQTAQSSLACSSAISGSLRYSTTSSTVEYCNSTAWTSLGPSDTTVTSFSVHKNGTDQTVVSGVATKLTWSTEDFDTNNNFSSDRFTPTVAGKYIINLQIYCPGSTACSAHIYTNGSNLTQNFVNAAGSQSNVTKIISMNGTTDYVEAYGYAVGTTIGGAYVHTNFSGALLGPQEGGSGGSATADGSTNDVQFNNADAFASDTGNFTYASSLLTTPNAAVGAGSAADPSLRFSTDTNTGLYSIAADTVGLSTAGAELVRFSAGGISSTVKTYIPVGSAAAPAYSYSTDTDTGLYAPYANALGFAAGGTDYARVTSAGISTTNLIVHSASPRIQFTDTSTDADARINADSGSGSIYLEADYNNEIASSAVGFRVDGSDKMIINALGNVGVGTIVPEATVHVSGSFLVSTSAQVTTPTLYAGTNGRVGIGTSSPIAKLDVTGNISASGVVQVGLSSLTCSTAISGSLRYSTTSSTVEYCNSSAWTSLGPSDTTPISFHVTKGGTNQTGLSGFTKMTWSTENWDTNNNFASDRFTPTKPGKYLFQLQVFCSDATTSCAAALYKNGSQVAYGYQRTSAAVPLAVTTLDMNGSTDYVEAFVSNGGGTTAYGGTELTYFTGSLIGPQASGGTYQAGDGTAGAPGLTFSADTDTGWWRPTTNTMAASTGGTERLRLDATGLGIGTSAAPLTKLQVVGTSAAQAGGGTDGIVQVATGAASGDAKLQIGVVDGDSTTGHGWIQSIESSSGYRSLALNPGGGNVGIGTSAPHNTLDVVGGISARGGSNNSSDAGLHMFYTGDQGYIYSLYNGVAWKNLNISGLTVTTTNNSDVRMKTDIHNISSSLGLEGLMKLRPVTYHWKDVKQDAENGEQIGLIAQEVERIYPHLVLTTNTPSTITGKSGTKDVITNVKTLNYNGLIIPLVKALQDLKVEFDKSRFELKAANDNLVSETAILRTQIKSANDKLELQSRAINAANDNYIQLRNEFMELKRGMRSRM